MELAHGKAEVIIAKQRHGPTGTVRLQFEGQFTRFSDLVEDGQFALSRAVIADSQQVEPCAAAPPKMRHEHRVRPKIAAAKLDPVA